MPSEILASAVVHKSATADLVEGGVAGAVDMITRRPLDFKKQLTVEATAKAIYSDLAAKTDPQGNALIAWTNEPSTFGALLQVFDGVRHERRDGQDIFGYGAIDPTWQAAIDHPDLAGVMAPYGINSALFEQTRKRSGGLVDGAVQACTWARHATRYDLMMAKAVVSMVLLTFFASQGWFIKGLAAAAVKGRLSSLKKQ